MVINTLFSKKYDLNIASLMYDFDTDLNQMLQVISTNLSREFVSEIGSNPETVQAVLRELNNCGLSLEVSIKPILDNNTDIAISRDVYHQLCYKCKQTIIVKVNEELSTVCPKCNNVLNWEVWVDNKGRKRILLKP